MNDPTKVQNDLMLLVPSCRARVGVLLAMAKAAGLDVVVYETKRTDERQLHLYNRKRSKIKKTGMHGKGLAVDVVFLVNGQLSWSGDWNKLAALGKKAGLNCGHYWKTFKDSAHFQAA